MLLGGLGLPWSLVFFTGVIDTTRLTEFVDAATEHLRGADVPATL